jgi:FAD-dependent urate hydroxylase
MGPWWRSSSPEAGNGKGDSVDVLIAGAGVGGLALARGLLADGHRVRVVEQALRLREGGAAVTIFSNGAAALARLGAPLVGGLGGLIEAMEIRDGGGAVLCRFDLRVMPRRTGFPVVTVPRERLLGHLAHRLPADLLQFGRSVEAVTLHADHVVEATDSQGDRHTA